MRFKFVTNFGVLEYDVDPAPGSHRVYFPAMPTCTIEAAYFVQEDGELVTIELPGTPMPIAADQDLWLDFGTYREGGLE